MAMPRLSGGTSLMRLPLRMQVARRDGFEAGDHAQQRGLAAAGRADEDGELAVLDGDVDALDDLDRAKEFADVLEMRSWTWLILAFDAAGEGLDEEAPREAEGDDGRQQVEQRQRAQQAVVDLVDAQEGAEQTERQQSAVRATTGRSAAAGNRPRPT